MGHNISERRARELAARERARAVSGWVVGPDGTVEEPQTPAGVKARRSVLAGRCGRRPDCGRRVTFDAAMWCELGHATTPLADVLASYRCGLVPCRLDWLGEVYPNGLPLGALLHDRGARVVVTCACGGFKPKAYAASNFAREVVRAAGVAALAEPAPAARPPDPVHLPTQLIRGACPNCGEHRWRILLFRTEHRTP